MKEAKKALQWIVKILRTQRISFRITGGVAANSYGSKRKLFDIDIDIPNKALISLVPTFKNYKIIGPKHYRDREWDVNYLSVDYHGQAVDLIGSDSQKIFNKNTKQWEDFKINLSNVKRKKVLGLIIPIISKEDLINYKAKIKRKVDLADLTFLTKD